jgi:putative transcriptional regulator
MKTRIRELRAKTGMTQEELAARAGVRRETIVFLEKGKYNPSLLLAWRVAREFGVPIEEVFLFEESDRLD